MKIDNSICVKCGMCVSGFNDDQECPSGAISYEQNNCPVIDESRCVDCGLCADLCALGAIG